MDKVDHLWSGLFGVFPSQTEREMISLVYSRVDDDSYVLIQSAIIIRMLYIVLFESKDSPSNILTGFSQYTIAYYDTLNAMRRSAAELTEQIRFLNQESMGLTHAMRSAGMYVDRYRHHDAKGPIRKFLVRVLAPFRKVAGFDILGLAALILGASFCGGLGAVLFAKLIA